MPRRALLASPTLSALLLYCVLAILLTYPLVRQLSSAIPCLHVPLGVA